MGDLFVSMSSRKFYFYSAVGSLSLASAIYVLFRSESLLMFRWANALGLLPLIHFLRSCSFILKPILPVWIVYSLPFALWTASYMLFVQTIWLGRKCIYRFIWFWIVPAVSLTSEFCQYRQIVPGTFDIFDLLTIAIAVALVLSIIALGPIEHTQKRAL